MHPYDQPLQAPDPRANTIRVSGKGAIHVVPDVTRLEVSISAVFDTYEAAYAQAKENSAWMVKILEYNHLSGSKAKTKRLDISEHQENKYTKAGNYIGSEKKGFDLSQGIKVDLGMDNILLNKIIRGVGKFIPNAQVNIGYTVQDPRPHQLKMLERAVKDATEKAKIMAAAAGCELGPVDSIDYHHEEINVYSQARNIHSNEEAMASNPESLDITPDDLVISDNVTVTWNLIPKK